MKYITELHAHCAEVSPCADMTAAQVVDRYVAAGYHSLVLANHYCDYVMDDPGKTWEERINHFLSGYRIMKEYAGEKLHIILGCELRFIGSSNDYLIFGMDEQFLIDHPDLHRMSLKTFSAFAKEHGLLIVQAHPFRAGMKIVKTKYLDGIEVFNGHPGHDSRNDIADMWAKRYGLLRTSGSDFHHPHSVEGGGIITDFPITSMNQLVEVIRSGDYTLRCAGPAAERDHMHDMPAKY